MKPWEPSSSSQQTKEAERTLWLLSSYSMGGIEDPGQMCGSVETLNQCDHPCRNKILMPGLCLYAGGVGDSAESGRGFVVLLEFIENQLSSSISLPPLPLSLPVLLCVAGCNYAVNFGEGEAC